MNKHAANQQTNQRRSIAVTRFQKYMAIKKLPFKVDGGRRVSPLKTGSICHCPQCETYRYWTYISGRAAHANECKWTVLFGLLIVLRSFAVADGPVFEFPITDQFRIVKSFMSTIKVSNRDPVLGPQMVIMGDKVAVKFGFTIPLPAAALGTRADFVICIFVS